MIVPLPVTYLKKIFRGFNLALSILNLGKDVKKILEIDLGYSCQSGINIPETDMGKI